MARLTRGIVDRAIVTPDKHFPLHDKKAINVVCQAIELVKPNIYIDLGDTGTSTDDVATDKFDKTNEITTKDGETKETPSLTSLTPTVEEKTTKTTVPRTRRSGY